MKKNLIIDGKQFSYLEEDLSYSNVFPITEKDARDILDLTQHLLGKKGIQVYLTFGTLLGAVRDKGLIKGDEDVDVFSDKELEIYNLLPYLEENGLHLVRYYPGSLFSFRINEKAYIDIYVLRPIKKINIWRTYCYCLHHNYTPKKYFKRYQSIDFLGLKCHCVENPEKLIEFWYGKSWRTPIRGHKFYYEVKSHWYWVHVVIPFFIRLLGWPYWRHLVLKKYKSQEDSLNAWNKEQNK